MLDVVLCFFNDTATTEIYTLSLHDALPILAEHEPGVLDRVVRARREVAADVDVEVQAPVAREQVEHRSEEHTSELQSRQYLVCRLLLEKKKHQCNRLVSRPLLIHLHQLYAS